MSNSGFSINYDYVDMGLPSGVLWATCNLGASSPEEAGGLFLWGGLEEFSTASSSFYEAGTVLPDSRDTATQFMGEAWRTPYSWEYTELYNNCNVTLVSNYNNTGVSGVLFTSKFNSATVFFPKIEYYLRNNTSYNNTSYNHYSGNSGYWTKNGSGASDVTSRGYGGVWRTWRWDDVSSIDRSSGFYVRAVKIDQISTLNNVEYVDFGLPSGTLWAKYKCDFFKSGTNHQNEYAVLGSYCDLSRLYINAKSSTYCMHGNKYADTDQFASYAMQQVISEPAAQIPSNLDPITQYLGGGWRMPTKAEFEELISNVNIEFITLSGWNYATGYIGDPTLDYNEVTKRTSQDQKVYKLTSKTDSSVYIYIPDCGYAELEYDSDYGEYVKTLHGHYKDSDQRANYRTLIWTSTCYWGTNNVMNLYYGNIYRSNKFSTTASGESLAGNSNSSTGSYYAVHWPVHSAV